MLPVKEHQKIFEAIKQGNALQVEEETRAHIRRSLSSIKETLEQYLNTEQSEQ